MSDLQSRLQGAVGDAYRIEKELGGGGMSRVFLAEEVDLGRRVVIKVLPPEMAAGVNQERFHREIQLAANLQHPHIVSLLTAGAQDDLLYYVMPYIKGESLRAKLAREGELPVGETVRILKEVIDALAYAHREGVVHRDIKPDNVLLSEGHAVVTDFGVAKAVTASSGSSSLTSLGVALGTPAYMAPEQAAADPHTDHRADIYAVGTLAYEMLCGQPPFVGPTPQAVMAAHMSDAAEPISNRRSAVSDVLNSVIMRCLEKRAADRWQKAEELLPHLDAILTPTGGVTPTGTAPLPAVDYEALARQAHPVRVAVLFGLASAAVLALVYFIMYQLGLPDWVFVGAVILLAIGLPIMLLTGHHERQRALTRTTGVVVTTPASGVRRWFTWRKSLFGGGVAFAGLGIVAAGYMATRMLGVGPAATLVTSGVLEERDRLIVADFENRTADSTIGPSITEALRVDLAQSPVMTVISMSDVAGALRRMDRDVNAPLDMALATEIAEREGIKAVVAGEIGPLGRGYVLSVRLVSIADGDELVAVRETADDDAAIIGAVDELSAKLRERIGESLRSIRANDPLDQVTTGSLEALRKFSQAVRAFNVETNYEKAIPLLEEAIALDTAFAMAYRKLGVAIGNADLGRSRQVDALTKAFQYRHRLTERERYITEGSYYSWARRDRDRAVAAYEALLEKYPFDGVGLSNLGVIHRDERNWAEAEELFLRGIEVGPNVIIRYRNAIYVQASMGKLEDAKSTLALMEERFPGHASIPIFHAAISSSHGEYAAAEERIRGLQAAERSPRRQADASGELANLALVRGQLTSAKRHLRDQMRFEEERNVPQEVLQAAVGLASVDILFTEAPQRAWRELEAVLQRYPVESLPASERPYLNLAYLAARAGRPDRAEEWLAQYEAEVDPTLRTNPRLQHAVPGVIALAHGRTEEAVAHFRRGNEDSRCPVCNLPDLARAYDQAGEPDSAIATYERYLASPWLWRIFLDSRDRAPTYQRLGELYEERGERDKAVEYYDKFVDLWKNADPELQPVVADVRGRIARLVGENR